MDCRVVVPAVALSRPGRLVQSPGSVVLLHAGYLACPSFSLPDRSSPSPRVLSWPVISLARGPMPAVVSVPLADPPTSIIRAKRFAPGRIKR